LLREVERRLLEDRLGDDPQNFAVEVAEFPASLLEPSPSLWRKTYGRWAFCLPGRGEVVLAFVSELDLLAARNHLPRLLGDSLHNRLLR
jgi:hypothetical protein